MLKRIIFAIGFFIAGSLTWAISLGGSKPDTHPAPVDFNREVRPILSEHCYTCHGPDENKRKAGLRLDTQEGAFKELKSGNHALVSGNLTNSTLVERIVTTDEEEIMPPPKHNKPLKPEQIALLKRWVQEGAQWQKHWSFIPPERPQFPSVKNQKWPRNAIDHFTLARLEKENLKPNPEANKATLIRRVTFDLTGLPPTIEEVDAFLADKSRNAYEKLVERLLASPHYGERMAQTWLDLARYADTSGYHFDGVRFMWLWRDWVIKSFNDNKPYDEFTVEQLAGDLLPNPTQSQRIATGFVRNNMTNDEGGADPDEYLNKYVVDRVNTVGAVWLGLTVGCTECHSHKYDPLTTKEFYQMYAFFHNVPEKGLDRIRTDNPPPRLPVPTSEQALQFVEADFRLKDAEKTLADRSNELGETQEKWELELNAKPHRNSNLQGLLATLSFDDSLNVTSTSTNTSSKIVNAEKPEFLEGRIGKALKLDGKAYAEFESVAVVERTNAFSFAAWVKLDGDGAVLSKMEKGPGYRGFDLFFAEERFQIHLLNIWPTKRLALARWLVAKEHPLMARVTVNRYWSTFFGSGLVHTINDFGSQGEWPSHPDLLDWLAVQFRDGSVESKRKSGQSHSPAWDVKGLVRLIVTSATYRQSAVVTPEKLERDSYTRLFTRGPRVRLDAEFVRDNALAVSGLLNDQIGGPSVKPYQPPGIWDGTDAKYEQDKGDALYRRGMYVFWRRSAHYPSFATFDAPSREVCTFFRERTQTPLQSLVLMNDPAFVETARGLAARVMKEEPNDSDKRIARAFRHTLGRMPESGELTILKKTYEQQLANFRQDSKAANAFLKVGDSPLPEKTDPAELAAMTTVANVLLNLNEAITK